jgi:hypothetical protein
MTKTDSLPHTSQPPSGAGLVHELGSDPSYLIHTFGIWLTKTWVSSGLPANGLVRRESVGAVSDSEAGAITKV